MTISETRRKRRNSSISKEDVDVGSPASRTRSQSKARAQPKNHTTTATTPRHPRKKVRFSDPGPSTGLTPALLRTSFDEGIGDSGASTPSRQVRRRRSTPLPRARRWCDTSSGDADAGRVVQFTPLRQILDPRTQRRIRRTGLSDEIHHIEREKRDVVSYEKTMQSLQQERDALRKELETMRTRADSDESSTIQEEASWMAPEDRIEQLEAETNRLRGQVSFSSATQDANHEGDTIMINDTAMEGDTILLSDSPDMRGIGCQPAIPDFSLLSSTVSSVDASTQAQLPDSLALDLETARKEKTNLFNACRAHISSLDGTALGNSLRQSSPSPDFLDQIVPTLSATLARASEAAHSLESVKQELSKLGFPGSNASDIISEMRSSFRTARIELERAVPGETANTGLEDGHATLGALVKRVELLVKNLGEEQTRHDGSLGRERALKGQFDTLLVRYEAASKKIHDLEKSSSSSASDMLHTRMRMQELEREGKEQAVGIDRLNAALEKYRQEMKGLEALVTGLEEDKATCKERYRQQVSELESKVAGEEKARCAAETAAAERNARIHGLEQTVENNRIRTCDLMATVERLIKERQQTLESLEQQASEQREHHEQEIGTMNVRISELNTAVNEMRSETEKLRHSNMLLEEQLQLEVEARDNLLDKWAAEQARSFTLMKETVTAERRKAKVRTANFEMKSNDSPSDSSNTGSEPITPASMSSRYIDVEVGRGKSRRRLDSGIGILTEDELLDDMNKDDQEPSSDFHSDGIDILPSDPAHIL